MKKRENIKTKGIILGSKTLGETDKLLFILTRDHGKIKVIAKGSHKTNSRFAGKVETLNTCTFNLYRGPNSTILTDIEQNNSHRNLRDNLERITNAMIVAKITDELLLEEETTPEVFDLVEETITALAKTEDRSLLITTTFLIKLLDHLGLLPDLKEFKGFHTPITHKYKKLFNYIQQRPLKEILKIKLSDEETIELKRLIKDIIETETEKALKIPF